MIRFVIIVALVLSVAAVWAGDSPFLAADADPILALKCRKAIAADGQLAGLPLVVDVVNRVALVGGPVSSLDLVPRIEAALAPVKGLETVKVSCWVPSAPDPLLRRVGEKLRGELPPAAPPLPSPPVKRDRNGLPPLVMLPHVEPAPARRAPAPEPPAGSTVTRYPASGWLGEPIATPAGPLPGLLASARHADRRFVGLVTESKAGVVTVSGRVGDHADTWDYVAEIRKLPGVSRVIVGRVVAD